MMDEFTERQEQDRLRRYRDAMLIIIIYYVQIMMDEFTERQEQDRLRREQIKAEKMKREVSKFFLNRMKNFCLII